MLRVRKMEMCENKSFVIHSYSQSRDIALNSQKFSKLELSESI